MGLLAEANENPPIRQSYKPCDLRGLDFIIELLYGIHIVTTPQVQANVEAGYQEILRQLRTLQQKDDLLLQQISLLAE